MTIAQRLTMVLLAAATATAAMAADQVRDRVRDPAAATAKNQDRLNARDRLSNQGVYGSQLMTPEERQTYRAAMRAATTAEEREQVRAAHHEQMKIRAKERGVTLPDAPPAKRGGMGGAGAGMGGGGGGGAGGGGGGGGMGGGARNGAGAK